MADRIEDVRSFWDRFPLGADSSLGELGTAPWATELDRVKTDIGLAGVIEMFAPSHLPDLPVLDVGCGTGYWARLLIPRGVIYHGIDISPKAWILRADPSRRGLQASGLQGGQRRVPPVS